MKHLEELKNRYKGFSREELISEIEVRNDFNNQATEILTEWFAVITEIGIIAYFGCEDEAYHYKFNLIDRIL